MHGTTGWDHFLTPYDCVAANMKVTIGDTIKAARVVLHYFIPVLHVCVFLRDSGILRDSVTFLREEDDSWPFAGGFRNDQKVTKVLFCCLSPFCTKVTKVPF